MRVLTAAEMRAIDSWAIEDIGLPSLVLMENAGVGALRAMQAEFGSLTEKRIHILIGPGNNGGDGLVIARHLSQSGAKVKVSLLGTEAKLSIECRHNLEVFRRLDGEVQEIGKKSLAKLRFSLGMADLIIDCMLGVGATLPLRGIIREVVSMVNGLNRDVVAIDLPTGVDGTTGRVDPTAIRANLTLSLAYLKVGLLLYPGREFAGKCVVVDIGIPKGLDQQINRFLATDQLLHNLPKRPGWGHKGTFGHGLVVAGSANFAGAAYLSALSLLRSGAGMVTLAVPESLVSRFPTGEIITVPIPDTPDASFGKVSIEPLQALLPGKTAMVLGPGLSLQEEIGEVVWELLKSTIIPVVLDADGLNALSNNTHWPRLAKEKAEDWIFTPHPGEMARLSGFKVDYINANRLKVSEDFSKQHGVVLLLKGMPTVIAGAKDVYINTTGNPGMATAGTGDVLAGMIAGLVCQGMPVYEASVLGAYLHGKAGDIVGQTYGQRGLIASDIIEKLPTLLG